MARYKYELRHLKQIDPLWYQYILDIVTEGADIRRSEALPGQSLDYCGIQDPLIINLITKKLHYHILQGHLEGPYSDNELPYNKRNLHYSPVFGFLKSSNKPVFIVDLSSPKENSVNSAISQADRETSYPLFRNLCELANVIGPNGWFWTADALDAYWKIPIKKCFQKLFAITWRGKTLIFNCLSFGLASAPAIYNKFIRLFVWLCEYHKYQLFNLRKKLLILQYLDDFFGGHPDRQKAQQQKDYLLNKFQVLNLPTSENKCNGPAQVIIILGWIISSIKILTINLTEKKRKKYLELVKKLLKEKKSDLFHLEKVIGYLRYSSYVIIIGKLFIHPLELSVSRLRWNIEHKKINKYKKIHLKKEEIYVLLIWVELLKYIKKNPTPIKHILYPDKKKNILIWTDASTKKGIGGFDNKGNWYQFHWKNLIIPKKYKWINSYKKIMIHPSRIQYFELLSIIIQVLIHARYYTNCHLVIRNDNATAVKVLQKGSVAGKSALYYPLLNLLKIFATISIKYKFTFDIIKVNGDVNDIADALSRFKKNPFSFPQEKLNKRKFKPRNQSKAGPTTQKVFWNTIVEHFMSVNIVKPII